MIRAGAGDVGFGRVEGLGWRRRRSGAGARGQTETSVRGHSGMFEVVVDNSNNLVETLLEVGKDIVNPGVM